jgi:hypothetical protein
MILAVAACSHKSAQTNAAPLAPVAPPPVAMATPAPTPAAPMMGSHEHIRGIASATVITIHGKVVSVNRAKKQVTLEGPGGKQVTVHVYNLYNLEHAKVGQRFVAKFYEIITIVKQKPDPSMPPVSVAQGIVTAEPGQTPGSAVGRAIRLVATIEAVNHAERTVVIKGPDGADETVKVSRHDSLKHLKVGDQIVLTLTDVVAVELKPDNPA